MSVANKTLEEKKKWVAQIRDKAKKQAIIPEYHQLHNNKVRNQEIEKEDGFNLQKHLAEGVEYYCENMSEEQKKNFISRIGKGNNIQHLSDLDYFPTDHPEHLKDVYSKDSLMHKKGNAITQELLKEFCNANSRAGNDLKKILKNSEVDILIRSKWDRPNGSASFKRKGNGNEKDKIVICLSDKMFADEHIDKLPGLLAHEASHILDFKKRSGGHHQYMDGAETYADITGQVMAAKAGYSSLYWGQFMNDAFNADGRKKMEFSPDGDFRLRTIETAERINPPSSGKNVRDLSSYKKYTELEKIASLRVAPIHDNREQRNNFVHNATQGRVSYTPTNHGR